VKLGARSSDPVVRRAAASTVTVVYQAALPPRATSDELDRHERALEIADAAVWPSWELGL
jgi:hypothetical protein